jgi:hypothetical protein
MQILQMFRVKNFLSLVCYESFDCALFILASELSSRNSELAFMRQSITKRMATLRGAVCELLKIVRYK